MQDTIFDRNLDDRFVSPGAYVGYSVRDPKGRRLGSAKEVYVNELYEPEYIEVNVGLLGLRTVLVPVLSVAVDEERRTLTLQ